MKKHILWLLVALALCAGLLFWAKANNDKIQVPGGAAIQEPAKPEDNADKAAAEKVDALIGKISDPVTLEDKAAIEEARAAYDALTPDQKKLVETYPRLEEAEKAFAALSDKPISDSSNLKKGSKVRFKGGNVYKSSKTNKVAAVRDESNCKITMTSFGSNHPYHLVSTDGKMVYGWVDVSDVEILE